MLLKRSLVLLSVLLLGVLPLNAFSKDKPQDSSASWKGLQSAWQEYLAFPSTDEFDDFVKILRGLAAGKGSGSGKKETLDYLFQNSGRLFGLVQIQNPKAVEAAFLLLSVTNGDFKTKINANLGELASINPTLFLRTLKENRNKVSDLRALLTTMTDVYARDPEAQIQQRDLRLRVFKEVKDPDLKSLRDECLKILSS